MYQPSHVGEGFAVGFVVGSHAYCMKTFGCDVEQFREKMTDDDFYIIITKTIVDTTNPLTQDLEMLEISYDSEDEDTDSDVEDDSDEEDGGYGGDTADDMERDGDILYSGIPLYGVQDLYRRLLEIHPHDHMKTMMNLCCLKTLLMNVKFITYESKVLFRLVNVLWGEYIRNKFAHPPV